MNTLLDALYTYAQEQRMGPLLAENEEDLHCLTELIDHDENFLRSSLQGPAAEAFSRYVDHSDEASYLRDQALLRCGLSIGLELSRL